MNHFKSNRCHRWITSATAGLAVMAIGDQAKGSIVLSSSHPAASSASTNGRWGFYSGNVLGTSLEVMIDGTGSTEAHSCYQQILAEIGRLGRILSTYHPESEISRMRLGGKAESVELGEVLGAYENWKGKTNGAIDANLGDVMALWKAAGTAQRLPSKDALRRAYDTPNAFNIDALGKGYVVDCAVRAGSRLAAGGLINLGGDIRCWGSSRWAIGVRNPANPADNAPTLGTFEIQNSAVATSGGYARFFTVVGQRYSHIIDPRSLWPIDDWRSATVLAPDCMSANALSTAGCVLEEGQEARRLTLAHGGQGLFLGNQGPGRPDSPQRSFVPLDAATQTNWPAGYKMAIKLSLKFPQHGKIRSPYVATWVESSEGKLIKTVSVWGTRAKYQRELYDWWDLAGAPAATSETVTSATREAGKYTIQWDGTDDNGRTVPTGDYKMFVEIAREHGDHVVESALIRCGAARERGILRATSESDETAVEYGPLD